MDAIEQIRQQVERARTAGRDSRVAELRRRVETALQALSDPSVAVYLFGSWVSGRFDGQSDVDLLVIAPSKAVAENARDRLMDVADDVVAFTETEWRRRQARGDPFVRRIAGERLALYGAEGAAHE